MKDPPNLVRKEAFSAQRGPDGRCDWLSVVPTMKNDPIAESIYIGEKHERTCQGKFFLVTIPKEYRVGAPPQRPRPGETMSTSIALFAHIWEGSDTLRGRGRQARDIANAVLAVAPAGARLEQMMITDDTLASVMAATQRSRRVYDLRLRRGKWVPTGKPWPFGVPWSHPVPNGDR